MSSYFTLILDTTGPNILIHAPNYTLLDIETEIIVEADEELADYQEIYIVDTKGNRFDLTCFREGRTYRGTFRFNQLEVGIATIYARVKDSVNNPSSLASRAINVLTMGVLNLEIDEKVREQETTEKTTILETSQAERVVQISERANIPATSEQVVDLSLTETIREQTLTKERV